MINFFEALADYFHELHGEIKRDLEALPPAALDWKPGPEMNSVAIIIVHLTGAERFLVGDVVMQESSNRNRDLEFQAQGISKEDLFHRLDETEAYLGNAIGQLSLSDLETTRIHPRHGDQVTVSWALLHALAHTATHVGHINLTVQMWQQRSVGEG
jgi:uncharacterized damage-inducible protein DinB